MTWSGVVFAVDRMMDERGFHFLIINYSMNCCNAKRFDRDQIDQVYATPL
jgi:hypothetical protein